MSTNYTCNQVSDFAVQSAIIHVYVLPNDLIL